jgi:hypothetical protein
MSGFVTADGAGPGSRSAVYKQSLVQHHSALIYFAINLAISWTGGLTVSGFGMGLDGRREKLRGPGCAVFEIRWRQDAVAGRASTAPTLLLVEIGGDL